jgi:hypothetical protein
MAANAGYAATVYVTGTAAALSNEELTGAGSPYTTFQLTAAKRVIDPDTAIIVATQTAGAGDWNVDAASTYTVEPMFGTIVFSVGKGATDKVRINSGKYMPRLAVATATAIDATFSRASLDTTYLGASAPSKLAGLKDCSITLELIQDLQDDYDTGGGTRKLSTDILGGTAIVLDVTIGAGIWRAWVVPVTGKLKAPVAGLAGGTVEFVGQAKPLTGRSEIACWGHI